MIIYPKVRVTWTDTAGTHVVTTEMTREEIDRASSQSRRFYEIDVPLLTSGQMIPLVTVVVKNTELVRLGAPNCFWPDPGSVTGDLEPAKYDSAILIWKDEGRDEQGRFTALACYGGLSWPRGRDQGFASFLLRMLPGDHRNVLKHEWGHSILFYYDAAGTAPKPAVNNHINNTDTRYVSCHTGQPYILMDETDFNPVPHSIYNNQAGFTHDYYSGLTAAPDQIDRCLGITPQAWASGGPVSRPIANPGDLNGDSRIDLTDLNLLIQAIGAATAPSDRRDLDYDGLVTVLDARRLVTFCTNPRCAP